MLQMSQTFSPNAGLGMWIIWTASLVQNNVVFVNLGASLSTRKPCRPVLFCFSADAFVTGLAVSRLVRALWPPNRSKPLVIVVQLFSITPHADLVHQLVKKYRNVIGMEVGFLHLGSLASPALLTKATHFNDPFLRPSIQVKVKHNQHPFGGPCLLTRRALEPEIERNRKDKSWDVGCLAQNTWRLLFKDIKDACSIQFFFKWIKSYNILPSKKLQPCTTCINIVQVVLRVNTTLVIPKDVGWLMF